MIIYLCAPLPVVAPKDETKNNSTTMALFEKSKFSALGNKVGFIYLSYTVVQSQIPIFSSWVHFFLGQTSLSLLQC